MIIKAPWSDDICDRLNAVQNCGFMHPYTCGGCGSDLIAKPSGWVCEHCLYTQDWAHEPPTKEAMDSVTARMAAMMQSHHHQGDE